MRCSYTNSNYPELGTIYGTRIEEDGPFGYLFRPDPKYYEALKTIMRMKYPGTGLFVEADGVTVTPVE